MRRETCKSEHQGEHFTSPLSDSAFSLSGVIRNYPEKGSPPARPLSDSSISLKSLRESASFISEDILNYKPPSTAERRAKLRDSFEVSSPLAKFSKDPAISGSSSQQQADSSVCVGAREGEFEATSGLYTWTVKSEVPLENAAFRFTVSGRTVVVHASRPSFGVDSTPLMARSLTLPPDADVSELISTFHAGIVTVQIGRKARAAILVRRTSPKPMDTHRCISQSTEELMSELDTMLELTFNGAASQGTETGERPARPLSDTAIFLNGSSPQRNDGDNASLQPQYVMSQNQRNATSPAKTLHAPGHSPHEATAESSPTTVPPATSSASSAPSLNSKAHLGGVDVLKRCQELLKRSQEQSKDIFEDVALPVQLKVQVPVTQDLFSLPENSQNRMHGARLGEWVGGMEPSPDGSFDAANTSSIHFSQGHLRPSRSSGPGQPQGGQGQPHSSRQFTHGQPHPLMGGSFDASSGSGQSQVGNGQPHSSRQFTHGQPHPLMGGSFDASLSATPPLPHPLRQSAPSRNPYPSTSSHTPPMSSQMSPMVNAAPMFMGTAGRSAGPSSGQRQPSPARNGGMISQMKPPSHPGVAPRGPISNQPHPPMGGSFDASTQHLPRHPLRQTMPAGSEVFM